MKEVRIRIGSYIHKIYVEEIDRGRLKVKFGYHKELVSEIGSLEGARWNPDGKFWIIANSPRNKFQFDYYAYILDKTLPNPYARYDSPLIEYESSRKIYDYQLESIRFILTRLQCILALEPGTGKTLIAIECLEELIRKGKIRKDNNPLGYHNDNIWWVGPKSGLIAVEYEFSKWKSFCKPVFMTYERMRSLVNNMVDANRFYMVPNAIVFDESQKIKNPTSQRAQAAQIISNLVREKDGLVLLMTGTPAPKSPSDWWKQAEVAKPGFLKEGDIRKFNKRLGLIKTEESLTGGMYPKLVTWWDNPKKCAICGKQEDSFEHDGQFMASENYHRYRQSKNEVELLYKRLSGLTLVKLKKDVLSELPDINYRIINLPPSKSTLRAASLITRTSKTTIEALTLLRELSDGFQYKETESGEIKCKLCNGLKIIRAPVYIGPPELFNTLDGMAEEYWEYKEIDCTHCSGEGVTSKITREAIEVPTPKDKALIELLEEYEDVGRVVIFGGFIGTVDKVCKLTEKNGWSFIKVDGRGWNSNILNVRKPKELLTIFQDYKSLYEKVAFVSQPSSGGVSLTLTASPVEIFYSNDFSGDSRMQALHRIHRPGMDINKGATVIDLIHLETDRLVLNNLEKKIDLQKVTMGDINKTMENQEEGIRYI